MPVLMASRMPRLALLVPVSWERVEASRARLFLFILHKAFVLDDDFVAILDLFAADFAPDHRLSPGNYQIGTI
jgi:hypothetical protein